MKLLNYIYRNAKNKAVVAGFIAITACWAFAFPVYAEIICITQLAHQQIINMKTGDELEINLEGNPTTGYVWEKVEGDNSILQPVGDYKYVPGGELVGSGGNFVFTFLAVAAGKTRLRIIYHRTFEKNVAPVKIFEVTVIVKCR